jgi:hypothetical protein
MRIRRRPRKSHTKLKHARNREKPALHIGKATSIASPATSATPFATHDEFAEFLVSIEPIDIDIPESLRLPPEGKPVDSAATTADRC